MSQYQQKKLVHLLAHHFSSTMHRPATHRELASIATREGLLPALQSTLQELVNARVLLKRDVSFKMQKVSSSKDIATSFTLYWPAVSLPVSSHVANLMQNFQEEKFGRMPEKDYERTTRTLESLAQKIEKEEALKSERSFRDSLANDTTTSIEISFAVNSSSEDYTSEDLPREMDLLADRLNELVANICADMKIQRLPFIQSLKRSGISEDAMNLLGW